ncbi:MAG: hypothetical protein LUH10_18400, partial [Tannerellaceae bacterium]|nr:hypothetical protein [Tannerellaceae bacterium]
MKRSKVISYVIIGYFILYALSTCYLPFLGYTPTVLSVIILFGSILKFFQSGKRYARIYSIILIIYSVIWLGYGGLVFSFFQNPILFFVSLLSLVL